MNLSVKEHWDKVYSKTADNKLGWFEEFPFATVDLFNECRLNKNDTILIVGAGTSSFVNYALGQKYENIIVTDISSVAMDNLKEKLGNTNSKLINCIIDDITEPEDLNKLSNISLWYDRAVLHFFLEERQRQNYFALLKKVIKEGGYAIIAEFSLTGAKRCSGLDVMNYDQNIIQKYLGDDFKLIKYFDYIYNTPSGGTRPYIYTLFQRLRV